MIRFYPETVHTGTVPSLLVFLTTNHYPLTTVLPHHGLMIDTQTATAPPPPPVSRPAFLLTTNHYPLTTVLPHHGLMIDTQTATAPPPPPVSRPAFFLTTNHYPLTTAFPAPTHSMIKTGTSGTRNQASEGAGKAGVSARRAESRELKPEDCFPLFRSLSPEFYTEQIRNPAPIGVECGPIFSRSLTTGFLVFLTTNH